MASLDTTSNMCSLDDTATKLCATTSPPVPTLTTIAETPSGPVTTDLPPSAGASEIPMANLYQLPASGPHGLSAKPSQATGDPAYQLGNVPTSLVQPGSGSTQPVAEGVDPDIDFPGGPHWKPVWKCAHGVVQARPQPDRLIG
ncbi:hypothetical protein DL89DRAFT_185965 [Linderina pennispora]|uniref:Uncharacterized protein n=1 Tax=Linderina pennispora TaxID=61395 RepID=A0A1Y1VT36_9FUNG|nr:uncharacterized protein DL89DRAFT_185965 [Linderina pennispora]ORX64448.1 hypothetical protein DL89DRAFT_185965 [Linderina pennispora]